MKSERNRSLILLPAILLLAIVLGVVAAPFLLPVAWLEHPIAVVDYSSLRLAASVGLIAFAVVRLAYLKWIEDLHLQRDRDRLGAILEHVPEDVYFKDRDSRFVRVGSSMVRFWGLAEPAQAARNCDVDMLNKEHANNALANQREIVHSGRSMIEKEESWPDSR